MSLRSRLNSLVSKFERDFDTLNSIEVVEQSVLHNFDTFQGLLPETHIFPVLKANAYGHGITQIAQILKKRQFPYLVVDSYFEALRIWEVSKRPVLLIGYTELSNYRSMDLRNIAITVYDIDTIKALSQQRQEVRVHLKVDTGMSRQGVDVEDLPKFLDELQKHKNLKLEGILSHLADADGETADYTEVQKENFQKVLEILESKKIDTKYVHLGATAGSLKTQEMGTNAIRLGLGLYGYNPLPPSDPQFSKLDMLQPALHFTTRLISTRRISKGTPVSYNCTYKAPEDMEIGVVPVGYYDGVDRRLSNKGFMKCKGKNVPIIGRICMNLTVLDLRNAKASLHDTVEVISLDPHDKNSVSAIAKTCDTIVYDILVRLSESTRRTVV